MKPPSETHPQTNPRSVSADNIGALAAAGASSATFLELSFTGARLLFLYVRSPHVNRSMSAGGYSVNGIRATVHSTAEQRRRTRWFLDDAWRTELAVMYLRGCDELSPG